MIGREPCVCCEGRSRPALELTEPVEPELVGTSPMQFDAHDVVEIAAEAARLVIDWQTGKAS